MTIPSLAKTFHRVFSSFSRHEPQKHVIDRARAGSVLHQSALKLVDPIERGLIRFWCSAEDLLP